jgi:hypothetical protein
MLREETDSQKQESSCAAGRISHGGYYKKQQALEWNIFENGSTVKCLSTTIHATYQENE